MNSAYWRLYRTMAVLLLTAVLLLGVVFNVFMYHYSVSYQENALSVDCDNMVDLSKAYHSVGLLGRNINFKTSISTASRIADSDTLICDPDGYVVICSDSVQGCTHLGRKISSTYVKRAFAKGKVSSSSMVSTVYDEARLAVAMPLLADDGTQLGVVISSSPMTGVYANLAKTAGVFLAVGVLVLLVSLILMLVATHKQGQPLRKLAAAARQLGHGNLDVRLETDPKAGVEYSELVVAFNNMASSLQSTEAQRQEFIANVSHELKTPMTTIAGYMDGMLDGTIPPEQHAHYMQIVSDEVRRLSRLVRSMLEISRAQSVGVDKSRRTRFDVADVVGQTLLSFEQRIESKHLDVQADLPEEPAFTMADCDAITQVVYNLLDNAIKFCNEGGLLGVQMWFQNGKINVSISNTGETIAPEELPLVFERFHKTDKSRSRNPDGAGLGLYIVKTIICSHGEDITVESHDGKTAFCFTLPLLKSKGKEELPYAAAPTKESSEEGRLEGNGAESDSGSEQAPNV